MREDSLRTIVEEVVKVLAQKGLLKGDCSCSSQPGSALKKTTIGTAGKIFSEDWVKTTKISAPQQGMAAPVGGDHGLEHTGAHSCPQCEPVNKYTEVDLKAMGCDRLAVCHPTHKGSAAARMVDHTLLKPNATQGEIGTLCEEARSYCFASVCVNPSYVSLAARLLAGSGVKVCTVVGFPLGSTTPTVKAIEARDAIANGADEVDMVINVGALKSGNDAAVYGDIVAVRDATRGRILKVILETVLLTDEEKVRACAMAKKAGADFVKTSTGFAGGGATVEDVRLMRQTVGPLIGVKASGGIRDAKAARAMIEAGATRLGTSASVAIVTDSADVSKKGY